jgi:hypothetical protein
MAKQYLTEIAVAEMLSIGVQSLRNQRSNGRGLPYLKFGKAVRYCMEDIDKYLAARRIEPRNAA